MVKNKRNNIWGHSQNMSRTILPFLPLCDAVTLSLTPPSK